MSDQPLPPSHVDYRPQPKPPPPGPSPRSLQLIGLGVGSLVSLVTWPLAWKYDPDGTIVFKIVLVMFVIKIGTVFGCIQSRRWRPLGAGVLASIGIGFLIFFGTCWMNLK